jgi:hypothetical protein
MPKKSNFEGEGNPSEPQPQRKTIEAYLVPVEIDDDSVCLEVTPVERDVLRKLLGWDSTSGKVNGGLKSLLSFSDAEAAVLLGFLKRIPRRKTVEGYLFPVEIDDESVHLEVTSAERDVLRKLLDRDRTSREVHGGLKSLLSFSDVEAAALLGFLKRI